MVQCKFHTNATGDKAVQEAAAARAHYGTDCAVVIAKPGYTEAAKRLAATKSVLCSTTMTSHHECEGLDSVSSYGLSRTYGSLPPIGAFATGPLFWPRTPPLFGRAISKTRVKSRSSGPVSAAVSPGGKNLTSSI